MDFPTGTKPEETMVVGGNLTQLRKVGARLVVRKMANKHLNACTSIMLPSPLSLLINQ